MPTCATCCRNCLGRGLDSMSSAAPFQPLQFCDAVISGVARLGSAPLGRGMAPPAGDVSRELQESIRRALGRPRIHLLLRARLETKPRRLEERILALTAWRLHLFGPTTPAKAEGSLSVLEIRCISATSPTQVRLDTERGPLALALASPSAAACLARELGAALGRALPCAPPV
ncbi:capping protein, Arp2/3 and myosin-I linker protein 3-like isoform X6 [Tympanuchus pallidicinctus]|uniref:capping protein, Arp2/3 and myosin-I linker protein 3-like isoform X6 n=1 Tax=Tympanuchus pallidicinctus TaxID=109042 RepID=UPI002286D6BD|nr:capping protein, Arp2/3 and myosin-I linker protein 3-like isoform X6 [Tympanuchus pallidicinctus]